MASPGPAERISFLVGAAVSMVGEQKPRAAGILGQRGAGPLALLVIGPRIFPRQGRPGCGMRIGGLRIPGWRYLPTDKEKRREGRRRAAGYGTLRTPVRGTYDLFDGPFDALRRTPNSPRSALRLTLSLSLFRSLTTYHSMGQRSRYPALSCTLPPRFDV